MTDLDDLFCNNAWSPCIYFSLCRSVKGALAFHVQWGTQSSMPWTLKLNYGVEQRASFTILSELACARFTLIERAIAPCIHKILFYETLAIDSRDEVWLPASGQISRCRFRRSSCAVRSIIITYVIHLVVARRVETS